MNNTNDMNQLTDDTTAPISRRKMNNPLDNEYFIDYLKDYFTTLNDGNHTLEHERAAPISPYGHMAQSIVLENLIIFQMIRRGRIRSYLEV